MQDEMQTHMELNEESEFDYYLMWEWPQHIENALRRLLWISLVEAAEGNNNAHTNYIRWQIATYPDSPSAVLEYLCQFDNEQLLVRIAENPQASTDTLARLSTSKYNSVRIAVADNQNTPIHAIRALTLDEDVDVRYSMAENPALPATLLAQLSADSNAYVATRAARTMARRNPASIEQFPRTSLEERKLG